MIVDYYMTVEGINLAEYAGLTEECFHKAEGDIAGVAPWSEKVGELGTMHHAFPETKMVDTSWKRDKKDKQYVQFVSDGDLNMLPDLISGMGGGHVRDNREGGETAIIMCSFHKVVRLHDFIDAYLAAARYEVNLQQRHYEVNGMSPQKGLNTQRVRRLTAKGKCVQPGHHGGTNLLLSKQNATSLFGALLNECMNVDDPGVAKAAWYLFTLKCKLMGLHKLVGKINYYHHPVTGKQGMWGRSNQAQEQAIYNVCRTIILHGIRLDSNCIEANMNKKLKLGTGKSLPYGALVTAAQLTMTNLDRNSAARLGFSVVGDQLGQCDESVKNKACCAYGADTTGKYISSSSCTSLPLHRILNKSLQRTDRFYEKRVHIGVQKAQSRHHNIFNHRISGSGRTAEYLCASDQTVKVVGKWELYDKTHRTAKEALQKVKTLRDAWKTFMKDPTAYIDYMLEVHVVVLVRTDDMF
jgi:hypothetical protein